jgi:hypothetical protein
VPGASVNYDVVPLKLVKLSGDLRLRRSRRGIVTKLTLVRVTAPIQTKDNSSTTVQSDLPTYSIQSVNIIRMADENQRAAEVDETPISPIQRRDSLEKHLQHRPNAQDLKNRNILLNTNAAPLVFIT